MAPSMCKNILKVSVMQTKLMQILNRRDATGVGVCATEVATAKDSANPCYDEIKLKDTKKHKGEKQFRF